jgi:hypothetical protein
MGNMRNWPPPRLAKGKLLVHVFADSGRIDNRQDYHQLSCSAGGGQQSGKDLEREILG